ncbi:MAG: hypothetical protein ACKO1N_08395 [Erythrobacter sp.]
MALSLPLAAVPLLVPASLSAQPARKPDLADAVAGTYFGDVISDARGSSRSDVTITVTRVGPNTIQVTSDYRRLPEFTTKIERVADTVQQIGTAQVFLLERARTPQRLNITVDDASWAGERQ